MPARHRSPPSLLEKHPSSASAVSTPSVSSSARSIMSGSSSSASSYASSGFDLATTTSTAAAASTVSSSATTTTPASSSPHRRRRSTRLLERVTRRFRDTFDHYHQHLHHHHHHHAADTPPLRDPETGKKILTPFQYHHYHHQPQTSTPRPPAIAPAARGTGGLYIVNPDRNSTQSQQILHQQQQQQQPPPSGGGGRLARRKSSIGLVRGPAVAAVVRHPYVFPLLDANDRTTTRRKSSLASLSEQVDMMELIESYARPESALYSTHHAASPHLGAEHRASPFYNPTRAPLSHPSSTTTSPAAPHILRPLRRRASSISTFNASPFPPPTSSSSSGMVGTPMSDISIDPFEHVRDSDELRAVGDDPHPATLHLLDGTLKMDFDELLVRGAQTIKVSLTPTFIAGAR
ncbi:hypothetical protein DFJ77DRAFT_465967 [Powellomyces hirtus]|nr:hypothetical protein DFJ77DRAFT_465967 [Powellomyces hirtus]